MSDSPTTRSLEHLRERGWTPRIVERRLGRFVTVDLFGFADIIAIKHGNTPILVQTTTGANLAARRKKIYASDLAPLVLQSGFRIVLHGWRKLKGQPWAPLEEEVTLTDIMTARARTIGRTA